MKGSNMDIEEIMNLWILVCSLIGSVYGFYCFFRPKKAAYLQLIASGVGCILFARLFQFIHLAAKGVLGEGFHIGMIGIIASFLFFLTANYGQIDGLVDDRSKAFRPTRIRALIAPAVILILYAVFFILVENLELRIVIGVVAFFIMLCTYYNFKHVIIYDVELGIVTPLKKYNALVIAYAVFTMAEFIGLYAHITPLYIVACAGIGIAAILLLPVLKGGVDKWTI